MPPIVAYPIWIRRSGVWTMCFPWIRRGGKWVQISEIWIRKNGKWTRSSSSVPF